MNKCLIIDDDKGYCELVSEVISRYEINTKYVLSLEEADKLVSEENFDWILVDALLPLGNGIEWIRNNSHLTSKLYILTGDLEHPVVAEELNKHSLIYNGNILKGELVSTLDKLFHS